MRLTIAAEPAVLGFLLDRPIHGYDLYKEVHQQLGGVWRLSLSQLYAIVKTFETRGWIEATTRAQSSRPAQKVLKLTPAGRQAFAEWLDQPAHGLREFRVDFFLRLYFARRAGPLTVQKLVTNQLAACERELASLSKAQNLRRVHVQAAQDLDQLVAGFRIQQLTAIMRWLENHRRNFARLKETMS